MLTIFGEGRDGISNIYHWRDVLDDGDVRMEKLGCRRVNLVIGFHNTHGLLVLTNFVPRGYS